METTQALFTYRIKHGSLEKDVVFTDQTDDQCVYQFMHKASSQSVDWNLQYEGWQIIVTNQSTQVSRYMKPSATFSKSKNKKRRFK